MAPRTSAPVKNSIDGKESDGGSALNDLIRLVSDQMPNAQPAAIARVVAERAPKAMLRDWLRELLHERVTMLWRFDRNTPTDDVIIIGDREKPPVTTSKKVKRRAQAWAEFCRQQYHIDGVWKPLGECTIDDLLFCIAERQELIDRTQAKIKHLDTIIGLMRQHRAAKVADLPMTAASELLK